MPDLTWDLGIDGGGTHWRWAAESSEGTRREGALPGGNVSELGWAGFLAHVDESLAAIFNELSTQPSCLKNIGLGISGLGRDEDVRRLAETLRTSHPQLQSLWAGGDALPALVAATGVPFGAVLIAGTGSLAWGRAADGRIARAGGWGSLLGDEGSAYDLGLKALQEIARIADGRAGDSLLRVRVLETLRLRTPQDLIVWLRELKPNEIKAEIAALASLVLDLARRGDGAAQRIRFNAASALCELTRAVISQLHEKQASTCIPLVLVGGLWKDEGFLSTFSTTLDSLKLPPVRIQRLDRSPAWGALALGCTPPST